MPKYIVQNAVIVTKDGTPHKAGKVVTLTTEEAEELKKYLLPYGVVEKPLDELKAKEVRELAKEAGVKDYHKKKSEDLVKELEEKRTSAIQGGFQTAAVKDDEPGDR